MKNKYYLVISVLIMFHSFNLYSTVYYAIANGDWNDFSVWSPMGVPGLNDNVVIDGYKISIPFHISAKCRSLVLKSQNRNAAAYLKVEQFASLTVRENMTMQTYSNDKDVDFYVYGRANIDGNLFATRTSSDNGQERLRIYVKGGDLTVDGNLTYNYNNADLWETDENEIEFNEGGTISCRNVLITKNSGGVFRIYSRNGTSTNKNEWHVSGDFTIHDNGGNSFLIDLHGYTEVNISGELNAEFGNSYDSNINIDGNTDFFVGGNVSINKSNGDAFTFRIDDNSSFSTENNLSIRITGYDSNDKNALMDISDNTRLDVGGSFEFIQTDNSSNNLSFEARDNSIINIGNLIPGSDFVMADTSGNQTYFYIRDNVRANINGNFSFIHYNAISDASLILEDDAQLNINGDITYYFKTGDDWHHLYFTVTNNATFSSHNMTITNASPTFNSITNFEINRDASTTINGDLELTHNTLNELHFYVNENSTSSTGVHFTVNGNSTIENMSSGSPNAHTYIHINRDATVLFDGNLNIDNHNAEGEFFVDINNNGTSSHTNLTINGDFIMIANNVRDMRLTAYNNANVSIGGDFEMIASGYATTWGDLNFYLTDNARFSISGNCTIDKREGAEFNFYMENNTLFTCNGEARFGYAASTENWAGFLFNFIDNAQCTIEGRTRIYNTSSSLHNTTSLFIDDDATVTIGKNDGTHSYDLDIRHNSIEKLQLFCGNNASLTVWGELSFDKQNNGPWDDATIDLQNDAHITVYDNLVLKNSNNNRQVLVRLEDYNTVLNVRGNIDMTSAVSPNRIKIQLDQDSKLHIGGSFLRNNTPYKYGILECNKTSTVYYDGDGTFGQQVIAENYGDGGDGFTYQNVVINNTWNNVPQLTMEGTVSIPADRNLAFIDGIVEATNTQYFIIQDDATVSDASDNSFVQGWIHKIGDDPFTFPVGDIDNDDGATRYAPLILTPFPLSPTPSTSTEFAVSYRNINPNAVGDTSLREPTLHHVSKEEYWLVEKVYANTNWDVTLTWNYPRSGQIDDVNEIRVAHWHGLWQDYGNDGTTGTVTNGSITVRNISNFSPFTLASTTSQNPLPIELLSFTAQCANDGVKLEWKTASEINNDYFTIKKSTDGVNWLAIGEIPGAGNSNSFNYYSFVDTDIKRNENYYYRLEQTDIDGKVKEVKTIVAHCVETMEQPSIKIYPNPNNGTFKIDGITQGEKASVVILNLNGQVVYQKDMFVANGSINSSLPNGIYYVQIISDNNVYFQKIIINH